MRKYLLVFAVLVLALAIAGCKKEQAQTGVNPPPITQTKPQPVGPPTFVAAGKTPEDHINDYFNAYKEQRLEDAFEMQPAENKAKQPKTDFLALRKSMPITEFKVGETKKLGANKVQIAVEYSIGQYGTWISTWEFEKKGDKWEALIYKASPKGQ